MGAFLSKRVSDLSDCEQSTVFADGSVADSSSSGALISAIGSPHTHSVNPDSSVPVAFSFATGLSPEHSTAVQGQAASALPSTAILSSVESTSADYSYLAASSAAVIF